jgi:hypothetical protein
MTTSYVVGLDPGQAADFSALAALCRERGERGDVYTAIGLKRWPLGTPYTDSAGAGVCEQLRDLLSVPPLDSPGTILAVDRTGVGRAVVDVLWSLSLPATVIPVTITAGHDARRDDEGAWTVPKRELVATLLTLLGQGRLVIPAGQALAGVLRQELADFRVKITAAAHETFSHREGAHDDLLLAVGVAAWAAERHPAFTRDSLGRGGFRGRVQPPAGAHAGGDFRRWPRGA